jgi:DNA-binding GntR family transcriptional regulator
MVIRTRARKRFEPARLELSADTLHQPLQRRSLHDQLIARLREMILGGELRPGSALPENKLCDIFGISRTPLREAFKVLAFEGLIDLRPHRTPLVTPVDPEEIAAVFEVMIALERLAGVRAARFATTEEIANLDNLHSQLVTLHRDGSRAEYFRMNQKIHSEITRLARNAVLQSTWMALTAKIVRARALANYDAKRWNESIQEHEQFMDMLRAGDADRFADSLADHMRRTGSAVYDMLISAEQKQKQELATKKISTTRRDV